MTRDWNRRYVRVAAGVSGDVDFRVLDGDRSDEEPADAGDGYVSVGERWLERNGIPAEDLD